MDFYCFQAIKYQPKSLQNLDFNNTNRINNYMKYRGVLYIQVALIALFIGLEYQKPELAGDPLFLLMPFVLSIITVFMTLFEETAKSSMIFGLMLAAASAMSFIYVYSKDFFFGYNAILIFAIALMAYSGTVLLIASARKSRKENIY